jgi:hypothetical protein
MDSPAFIHVTLPIEGFPMKNIKTLAIAAALTFAAAGAFAEGGIGGGDGVGDGSGASAGTTGWMAETLHGSTITANRMMPADGSNGMQRGTVFAGTRTPPDTTALGAGPAPSAAGNSAEGEREGGFFRRLFRR